jgi:hypothetical protein
MTLSFKDVLSAICSKVESLPSNDFQKIFLLGDEKEAGLACDILVAHGIVAKLYHENGTSRMYITQPSPELLEKLPAALAYAQGLKLVKQGLDMLQQNQAAGTARYNVNIANTSEFDRQISIRLTSSKSVATQPQTTSPAASQPASARPATMAQAKRTTKPQKSVDFHTAGPEIARQPWFQKKAVPNPDSYTRQMSLYVKGNVASATFIVMTLAVAMLIIYSLFVVSKGWLCPDFVTPDKEKNQAWYCR